MEGQQKETQYSGWHKDTTKKGLWSGEDNEVPLGNKEVEAHCQMSFGVNL